MKTKVIFRTFKPRPEFQEAGGDVIAIFPELPGDSNPYRTCLSYQHIGQHGAMIVDYTDITRPASPAEYADLQRELESIGYDLDIRKRSTRADLEKRIREAYHTPTELLVK